MPSPSPQYKPRFSFLITVFNKRITKDLEFEDRIERMQESECYITVKGHEGNFPHKISCRRISPSKSDIVKLVK